MEITIHTGFMGDRNKIHVDWYDENNVSQKTTVEINVQDQDKPRVLELKLDGVTLATIPAKNQ